MDNEAFVLLCAIVRAGRSQTDKLIPAISPDWPALIALAQRHHVVRPLLDGLRAAPQFEAPADVLATLRGRLLIEAGEVLRQGGELARIAQRFATIPMIVLKGLPLSVGLYGDAAARGVGDLDILVDPANIEEADRALTETGFTRTQPEILSPGRVTRYLRWSKTFIYKHPQSGTMVELHHRLTRIPALLPVTFDELWQGRREIEVGSAQISVLSRDMQTLYLCVHGSHHRWERLRWLIDVADIFEREPVQDGVRGLAERLGLLPVLFQAQILCRQWLGTAVDPNIAMRADESKAARSLVRGFAPDSADERQGLARLTHGWQSHIYQLSLRRELSFKIATLAFALTMPADADAFDLPDRLLWLLPILRPAGLFIRNTAKKKAKKAREPALKR